MSQSTDSHERIAADMLIAAIHNAPASDIHNLADNPQLIADKFKTIFKAVHEARAEAHSD